MLGFSAFFELTCIVLAFVHSAETEAKLGLKNDLDIIRIAGKFRWESP